MRLERGSFVCGVPVRALRDFIRRFRHGFVRSHVMARLGLNENEAIVLLQKLMDEGYIEPGEDPGDYALLPLGNALGHAKFLKPISRFRAEEIVRQLVERIEAVNANAELTYFVSEVIAFGSYADPEARDVADIDIVMDLSPRPPISNVTQANLARSKQSDRSPRSFLDELFFGKYEVIRLVKTRVAYISVHEAEDLELAKFTKALFQADLGKVASFVGPLKPN